MASKAVQYTVRDVPGSVDRALRRQAAERKVSLNRVLLDALEAAAGVTRAARERHDLDDFLGSWIKDARVDRALAEVRRVEPGDWED
jgi:hypothetical protein